MSHPSFTIQTPHALVAIPCPRNGYILLAPRNRVTTFVDLSPEIFAAAQAWARQLEALGAGNVLMIMLSEMEPHKHLHLYPRWPEDVLKGVQLFEDRHTAPQPQWTTETKAALKDWATRYGVAVSEAL